MDRLHVHRNGGFIDAAIHDLVSAAAALRPGGIMQVFARLLFISAIGVAVVQGENVADKLQAVPSAAAPAGLRAKGKRLKWLRRLCSAEVELPMRLSSIGIPKSSTGEAEGLPAIAVKSQQQAHGAGHAATPVVVAAEWAGR